MSKATISFSLPEEADDFQAAVKAVDMRNALSEIHEQVFRPARKHGYHDPLLVSALGKCGDSGVELVRLLEKRFLEILREYDLTELA